MIRRHFLRAMRKKRPDRQQIVLHMDNAPSHTAESSKEVLRKYNVTVLQHPPYSPDLAPCEFALFPRIKKQLRGRRFEDLSDLKRALQNVLSSIPSSEFVDIYAQWCRLWQKCTYHRGEYFEKEWLCKDDPKAPVCNMTSLLVSKTSPFCPDILNCHGFHCALLFY